MKLPKHIPLRLKVLAALLLVVTTVVSMITFAMANLFHEDKRTYITDVVSVMAMSTAEQARTLLSGYQERLQAYARILANQSLAEKDKVDLLNGLFSDFPELIGVAILHDGEPQSAAYNKVALESASLTGDDFAALWRETAANTGRIAPGKPWVSNSTLRDSLPMFTMALVPPVDDAAAPVEGAAPVVVAAIRLEELIQLAQRSRLFDLAIADSQGVLLASPRTKDVVQKQHIQAERGLEAVRDLSSTTASVTREYNEQGTDMIGGAAKVNFAGTIATAEIPRDRAYLTARRLLGRLLVVALALLAASALVSLGWARRVMRPIEQLAEASKHIGQGKFDTRVAIASHDEIGALARSFNEMATELKTREDALNDAQAALVQSEKMAAFGQLGAGIAHEVKNPLAGILGCAQLSLRKAEPGTPLHANLELIEKETKRCKTIVENLLKFARQEKAAFDNIQVNGAIEDAIVIVAHQLGLQQVRLEKALAPDLPMVAGNVNQLQQVFINLFMNAQQAIGGPGTIHVTSRLVDAKSVEIRVRDTGPGIPVEIRKKIFEPFFTTKPNGKGTGLGLSVSFGIIKDHGGEIGIESEPGKGATFIITLPARHLRPVATPELVTAGVPFSRRA